MCAVLGINKSLEKSRHNGLLLYNHLESIKLGNSPSPAECVKQRSARVGNSSGLIQLWGGGHHLNVTNIAKQTNKQNKEENRKISLACP